jgi:hypothetical protein
MHSRARRHCNADCVAGDMNVREKEILAVALRLSQASLLMLDCGLANIAADEPPTVRGVARR